MEYLVPTDQIANDVDELFNAILVDIRENYVYTSGDIAHTRNVLMSYTPSVIANKSMLLLDDLLNQLSTNARNKINDQENELINDFYNLNLSNTIKKRVQEVVNIDSLEFSDDPRLMYSNLVGGAVLVMGGGVALTLTESLLYRSLIGITSILTAAWTRKKVFEKTQHLAASKLDSDLSEYMEKSKVVVNDWLCNVANDYSTFFQKFCIDNNIK